MEDELFEESIFSEPKIKKIIKMLKLDLGDCISFIKYIFKTNS